MDLGFCLRVEVFRVAGFGNFSLAFLLLCFGLKGFMLRALPSGLMQGLSVFRVWDGSRAMSGANGFKAGKTCTSCNSW